MCCTATSKVNDISEKFEVKYGEIFIVMPIFMDDITAIGGAEAIGKGIRNCREMEIEKKMEYRFTKTNIIVIKTGKRYLRENKRRSKSWKNKGNQ